MDHLGAGLPMKTPTILNEEVKTKDKLYFEKQTNNHIDEYKPYV
jgi:hypothetical protein